MLDLEGRSVDAFADDARVRAFVFVSVDCPISNRYAPEIERISARYAQRGVTLRLVYPDAANSPSVIRSHLQSYGLTTPALRDPEHTLARRSGVTITPEAAVFVGARRVYHGRIDDRFAAFGVMRPRPTRRELVDALDAALAGRTPPVAHAPAVGCSLSESP